MSFIKGTSLKWLLLAGCIISGILLMPGCAEETKVFADSGKVVESTVGKEFVVSLDSNPTTGYSWQESHDSTVLKLVSEEYKENNSSKTMVGVGGVDTFHFEAIKAGSTEIQFTYKRPWESEVAKQMNFKVTVK